MITKATTERPPLELRLLPSSSRRPRDILKALEKWPKVALHKPRVAVVYKLMSTGRFY